MKVYVCSLEAAARNGLIGCDCGHPSNNHFSFGDRPCAHCDCKAYTEIGWRGGSIIELSAEALKDAALKEALKKK